MERRSPWVRIIVGLLIALSGVSGIAHYDSAWVKGLFVLVVIAGLLDAGRGLHHRPSEAG